MLPFTRHRLHLNLIGGKVNASNPHRTAGKELYGTVACRLHHRLGGSSESLPHLREEHLDAAFKESMALYSEVSAKNPNWKKVYDDYASFRKESNNWFRVADARFDNYMQSRLKDL